MSFLIRLNVWLTSLTSWIAVAALIAMMVLVTADAVARQIFNERIPFTSVLVANYMMVAIAFLPLGLAEMQDRNISVDLVFSHLSKALQRLIAILIHLAAGITASGLAWKMWTEAMRRMQSGTVAVENGIALQTWQGYFLLPAGFALLAFVYGLRMILGVLGAPEAQKPLPDGAQTRTGGNKE